VNAEQPEAKRLAEVELTVGAARGFWTGMMPFAARVIG
jgi:hypothetical protein